MHIFGLLKKAKVPWDHVSSSQEVQPGNLTPTRSTYEAIVLTSLHHHAAQDVKSTRVCDLDILDSLI